LELQILKILWEEAPQLAREVQVVLADSGRTLARTSVITTLNTMVTKKYLTRKKRGNTFLFSPRVTEDAVSGQVLGDVVDRVFNGSTSAVLLKLFNVHDIDREVLKELRQAIDEKLTEE